MLVVQTVMMLAGLGGDGDNGLDAQEGIDLDGEGEPDLMVEDTAEDADDAGEGAGSGLKLITVRGVVAFLAVSGWGGLWLLHLGLAGWLAVLLAVQLGTWAMLLLALILRGLMRLQADGTLRPERSLGLPGSVYLTIPAKRSGQGKVTVLVQEQWREFDAVTDGDTPLPTGGRVRVVGVLESGALVVRSDEEEEEGV